MGWGAMVYAVWFHPTQYDGYDAAASQTTNLAKQIVQEFQRGKQSGYSHLYKQNSSPVLDRSQYYGRKGRQNIFFNGQCCYNLDWLETVSGECAEFGVNDLSTGHPYTISTIIHLNCQHEYETADLLGSGVVLHCPRVRKQAQSMTNTAWDCDTDDLTGWGAMAYAVWFHPTQYDWYDSAARQTTDLAKQIVQEFLRGKQSGYSHLYKQNSSPALDRRQYYGSKGRQNLVINSQCCFNLDWLDAVSGECAGFEVNVLSTGHPYTIVTTIHLNLQHEYETADLLGSGVDLHGPRVRKQAQGTASAAWCFDTEDLMGQGTMGYAVWFHSTQYDGYDSAASQTTNLAKRIVQEF